MAGFTRSASHRGTIPSWQGFTLPTAGSHHIMATDTFVSHASNMRMAVDRGLVCDGCYAPDARKGMGSIVFSSSRILNV